jgi:hypothetical protein
MNKEYPESRFRVLQAEHNLYKVQQFIHRGFLGFTSYYKSLSTHTDKGAAVAALKALILDWELAHGGRVVYEKTNFLY